MVKCDVCGKDVKDCDLCWKKLKDSSEVVHHNKGRFFRGTHICRECKEDMKTGICFMKIENETTNPINN